ncbi:VWFA domain-containing protein [Plasmodiophora brassicae]|nr:secrectory protein [Plasmodiophora brassicae]CEO96517.1 hypothetical protein PBRA_005126 [Plasmodiophora brassicae]
MPLLLSMLSLMIWSPVCIRASGGETSCDRTEKLAVFESWAEELGIRSNFRSAMYALGGFEIIVLCDDSESMLSKDVVDDMGNKMTRWDELRDTVKLIVDFGALFDDNGIDVYFLNRPTLPGVTCASDLEKAFKKDPIGGTPLVSTVDRIRREKIDPLESKKQKVLLVIATDGQPSDGKSAFHQRIASLPENVYVSILACTDNRAAVAYLDGMDRLTRVDVTDDYMTELEQIRSKQGKSFKFSKGDYIAKALAGPIQPWLDQLDEGRVDVPQYNRVPKRDAKGTCCTIC